MTILEFFMVGMAIAFMGIPGSASIKPSSFARLEIIAITNKIQVGHEQSPGIASERTTTDKMNTKRSDSRCLGKLDQDALASVAFDDDVELLLSHGW